MDILGISCYYHDAAAALLRDGQLFAAAEEERFSRIKHDYGFPHHAIQFCLEAGGIRGADLDYVVFFEKPFRKFDRILMTVLQTYPQSWKVFRESMITWMIDKLWVGSTLEIELGVPKQKVLFCEHHISHAASAFLCSPFDEAAILTVDGVGEWMTATWGRGRGSEIQLIKQMDFPHSLGLLYSALTAFLGFEVNEGEYKVMGMAPYGQPRYLDKVWKLVKQNADGSFSLDMDYFCFHYSTDRTFNGRFEKLFGEPRSPKMPFYTKVSGFPKYFGEPPANYDEICERNQYYADIAASIQRVTEELLLAMAKRLHEETGQKRLCIAGGVGLNSVANARILRETPFEELYVQPAAGDGGGALGAALWAHNTLMGKPRRFVMEHAYWGRSYSPGEVNAFLEQNGIPHRCIENDDQLFDLVVEHLMEGSVVGWFQGRFEWGPGAGKSQHPRRCAQPADEGHRQRQDQVPRALPAVCPVSSGRTCGDLLRPAGRHAPLSRALHALCRARQAVAAKHAAGDHSRGWDRPLADRVPGTKPALLPANRAFWPGHRCARGAQYIVQSERRAHSQYTRERLPHLFEQ
jgi:carbamoyltransferase